MLGLDHEALVSTLGRILARGLKTHPVAVRMFASRRELETNMNNGDLAVHDAAQW